MLVRDVGWPCNRMAPIIGMAPGRSENKEKNSETTELEGEDVSRTMPRKDKTKWDTSTNARRGLTVCEYTPFLLQLEELDTHLFIVCKKQTVTSAVRKGYKQRGTAMRSYHLPFMSKHSD